MTEEKLTFLFFCFFCEVAAFSPSTQKKKMLCTNFNVNFQTYNNKLNCMLTLHFWTTIFVNISGQILCIYCQFIGGHYFILHTKWILQVAIKLRYLISKFYFLKNHQNQPVLSPFTSKISQRHHTNWRVANLSIFSSSSTS